MNDQMIMENLLLTEKGVCDLYLHGAIEAATPNVNNAFDQNLNESLTIQAEIYQKMAAKGWYANQQAPQQQVDQLRQKFAAQAN